MACGEPTPAPAAAPAALPAAAAPALSVEEWRARHEESYRAQYVTIAGLHALRNGTNTAGSAPGNDVVIAAPVPAAIGRFMLECARADAFKTSPVVVFLDEAHQFLNKRVGDEGFEAFVPAEFLGHDDAVAADDVAGIPRL